MTAPNVVPLRQVSAVDRLERLARRPLQARRDELRSLAGRLRALDNLDRRHRDQIDLFEAVA
jgi:hypothetical protein